MLQITRYAVCLLLFLIALPVEAQDFTSIGGEMTSTELGPAALQVFAPNVTSYEHQQLQVGGFNPFHRINVQKSGLGPRFVNASCGGCHVQNGRGRLRFDHASVARGGAMVVKVKYKGEQRGQQIGPVLQNHSVQGTQFHDIRLRWQNIRGRYPDGSGYTLRKPKLSFQIDGVGQRSFAHSLRMTPPVIGVGLLEAIDLATIMARADPFDLDKDGISGRINIVESRRLGALQLGRFGYKASQPTVEQQSAAAAGNEMGIGNVLFPLIPEQSGELSEDDLYRVTLYQKLGGVPAARNQSHPTIERGKRLFFSVGCESCHATGLITGLNEFPELTQQAIHPFTDLLLHDMGPGLADNHSEGAARGSEWRTTPLWGLGFSKYLSSIKPHYLHDGRARTLEESILWHGGESKESRDAFMSLDKTEREALISFLKSL